MDEKWILGGLAISIIIILSGLLIKKIFDFPERYRTKVDCDKAHAQIDRHTIQFTSEIRQDVNRISSEISRMDDKLGKKIDRVHERINGILTNNDGN